MKHRLTLSYDGTHYLGWQKTKTGPSIEQTLQTAIEQVLDHKVVLEAASRTDRGVHAHGQVVVFSTGNKNNNLAYRLNRILPCDIKITSHTIASDSFHPTLNAKKKKYEYKITNEPFQSPFERHFSWHVPPPLNLSLMQKKAKKLIGKADFSPFENASASPSTNPVCQIDSISIEANPMTIIMVGDRFLYKMARNIVGHLVYAGAKKEGRICAPAHGLTLKKVFY